MPRISGEYVVCTTSGEEFRAFIPRPLPPDPPLAISPELLALQEQANQALGRLDGISNILPDVDLFLYHYVRKEAVLSSQIEGTQSTYTDLLRYELEGAPGVPVDDVREVSNYVAAINHGLERLRGGFPFSLRLIREMHEILLSHGRGAEKMPGEFRRSQVWLGGTRPGNARFVPPPPERLMECLDPFEHFLHDGRGKLPVLVRAGLMHVQFETIHPFLDGNGRLGRMLITLMLCEEGALRQPLLYLSLHFKLNRMDYYDWLQKVRADGNWEGWLMFFLSGIRDTCQQAVATAQTMLKLFDDDRKRLQTIGRRASSCLQVHNYLQRKPLCHIEVISRATDLTRKTVTKCLEAMQELGMVRETTGQRRHRLFAYDAYLRALSEGTEPLVQ